MKRKTTPKYLFGEWLKKTSPSKTKYFIFHDPKLKVSSKRAIVSLFVRNKLHYRGYMAKVKCVPMTRKMLMKEKFRYKKGYEPLVCYLLTKKKIIKPQKNEHVDN